MMRSAKFQREKRRKDKELSEKFFLWILAATFGIITSGPAASASEDGYDAKAKRDPFIPLVTLTSRESSGLLGVESVDDLRIEGVVMDPSGSVIVVNGTVMREGDETGPLKVVKIESNGAKVLLNGNESFVPLYKEA